MGRDVSCHYKCISQPGPGKTRADLFNGAMHAGIISTCLSSGIELVGVRETPGKKAHHRPVQLQVILFAGKTVTFIIFHHVGHLEATGA